MQISYFHVSCRGAQRTSLTYEAHDIGKFLRRASRAKQALRALFSAHQSKFLLNRLYLFFLQKAGRDNVMQGLLLLKNQFFH